MLAPSTGVGGALTALRSPTRGMYRGSRKSIVWSRDAKFFMGALLDVDPDTGKPTGKILSSRESIDTTADKLAAIMINGA